MKPDPIIGTWPANDNRGMHLECDVCAHAWLPTQAVMFCCEFCHEPSGAGNAICPTCSESR